MTETIIMKMPALAVVGPDHRITRSTESFRRRYEDAERLCRQSPEIDRVLTGRTNAATVNVGDLLVAVEAVTDATGRRQAMLTLPVDVAPPAGESPVEALRDAADDSQAIVWVKDLEGRYLYANPQYARQLGTSVEELEGHVDADLPEAATVDGPRLRYAEDGLEEPLQLEYTVPAIERRLALAAFRFPLRDVRGEPIATCGVAAPVGQATVARDEAVRMMQLERWNRLDPVDVRAELLEQWHVQAAPPSAEEPDGDSLPEERGEEDLDDTPDVSRQPVDRVSRPDTEAPTPAPPPAQAPSPAASSLSDKAELLQADLQMARKWADRADQLQGELQQAQSQVHKAESETQQALAAAARASEDADRCRTELEQTRAELEQAQAVADVARSEVEAARAEAETAHADAEAARLEVEAAQLEVSAARSETESLRGPSTAALRLSEELGRTLALERERGDELERTLTRLRTELTDFESVFEGNTAAAPTPAL